MESIWRSPGSQSVTDSESAVVQIKKDIVSGVLAPNEKLRVKELIARYGIGASPMREALARLSGTGLVKLQGQKGFRVSPLAHDDLMDITRTRQIIEGEALALAIENGDAAWEAEIIKTFHLFSRELDRRGEASDLWLDAFEASHHAFHSALIAACPVQTLKSFCEDLYLRKERYRRVMFGYRFEINEVLAEHENLMKQILSRNVVNGRSALVAHIGITADVLAGLMPPPTSDKP